MLDKQSSMEEMTILIKVLKRNRINRVCVCVQREKEVETEMEIFKELAHMS